MSGRPICAGISPAAGLLELRRSWVWIGVLISKKHIEFDGELWVLGGVTMIEGLLRTAGFAQFVAQMSYVDLELPRTFLALFGHVG